MGEGTNSFSTASAIGNLLVANGLEARIQPTGGTTEFLPDLNSGGLAFGIANVLEAAQAFAGEGPWAGNAQTNLRILAPVAPLRVAFFVAADSDINSIADLRGKRVTSQFSAIQTLSIIYPAALANGGLTVDDIIEVPVPHVVPGADAFLDGRADAFFFAVVPSKPAQVHASIPLKVLPYDTSPEAIARMQDVFAFGEIGTVRPIPPLPFITEPTAVMSYPNMMVTASHVSDDIITQVADVLAGGKDALGSAYAPLRAFDPDQIGEGDVGTPYHDAIAAWAAGR
jgi:TRAP transporter TAXI family solute receptor